MYRTTFRRRRLTGLLVLAVAGAAAMGAYAFTASNTVPDHYAGAGIGLVSGYTISPVSYTFSADGTKVLQAEFTLDHTANDVKAALTATSTPVFADWVDCPVSSGTTVDCTFGTGVDVGDANHLSVAAVDNGTVVIDNS